MQSFQPILFQQPNSTWARIAAIYDSTTGASYPILSGTPPVAVEFDQAETNPDGDTFSVLFDGNISALPAPSASDFIFKVGNNNTPSTWTTAPAPTSISVRAGAGVSGSDRVELIWANGAITKKWLEVIVLANANTGLAQKAGYPSGQGDVFFFGNALGDSGLGDTSTQATVSTTDELGARNNPANVLLNIPITNVFDYNRDGAVNSTDALASRNNPTNLGNVVRFITVASPPASPEAGPVATASR